MGWVPVTTPALQMSKQRPGVGNLCSLAAPSVCISSPSLTLRPCGPGDSSNLAGG